MNRLTVMFIAALLAAGLQPTRAQQNNAQAEKLLASARHKVTVDGDLTGAIEEYRKVVAGAGANRTLTAQALVGMAECYQKLGDPKGGKVYERVVREFSDQKEAAAFARARLVNREPNAQDKGERAAWTGSRVDMFGQVSPDGRNITYVDWNSTGNVAFHDLADNSDHRITLKTTWEESGAAGGTSTISRDGKQVAYAWNTWGAYGDNGPHTQSLYIAPLQEGGHRQARLLFAAKDDVSPGAPVSLYVSPYDWSPDGKWIALAIEKRKDGIVQIALASVADGSVRVLKTLDWRGPDRIFFSTDGKYITYRQSVSDTTDESHVLVMAVDGSREITAVGHPSRNWPLGWSPDGSRLLFASDRTGSVGLWSLPFADGKPQGSPELLKADIGPVYPLGVTSSGALYVYKGVGDRDVQTASFDVEHGALGPVAGLAKGFVEGTTVPDWSPDGKSLAYAACDFHCIVIRSVESGESRRLRPLWYTRPPHWSPDGRSLIVVGRDFKGRNGIFLVDAATGQATVVVPDVNSGGLPQFAPDGRTIYYVPHTGVLRARELSSGTERELFRDPRLHDDVRLSPDGTHIAVTTGSDPASKTSRLLLVPAAGGEPRELLSLRAPQAFGPEQRTMAWTADGSALLVVVTENAHAELWKVPITGSAPRKLDIDVDAWRRGVGNWFGVGFSLSPDGRRIAFLKGKQESEVWALENFLPAARAIR